MYTEEKRVSSRTLGIALYVGVRLYLARRWVNSIFTPFIFIYLFLNFHCVQRAHTEQAQYIRVCVCVGFIKESKVETCGSLTVYTCHRTNLARDKLHFKRHFPNFRGRDAIVNFR